MLKKLSSILWSDSFAEYFSRSCLVVSGGFLVWAGCLRHPIEILIHSLSK